MFLGTLQWQQPLEGVDAANGPEITSIAQESKKGDAGNWWKRRKLEEQLAGAEKS